MWYYIRDGEQVGPADQAAIATLIRDGIIQRETLVWKDGLADWVPASATEINALFSESTAPAQQAPPLPAPAAARGTATNQQKTAGIAITSLVLGILGMILFGPLASIPAIICGHIAKSRIKKNPETLTGAGVALAGLILGYVQIAFLVIILPLMLAIAIPSFVKARDTAQMNGCINNMRMIDSGKEQWALSERKANGEEPDIDGVNQYIKASTTPLCPAGGSYDYNAIGASPECDAHGSLEEFMSGRGY